MALFRSVSSLARGLSMLLGGSLSGDMLSWPNSGPSNAVSCGFEFTLLLAYSCFLPIPNDKLLGENMSLRSLL